MSGVFFGSDFITVSKTDAHPWSLVTPEVCAVITEHFSSGAPLFNEGEYQEHTDTVIRDDDSEVVAMIKELLATRIRPSIQEDGGDLIFHGFDEETGDVQLELVGACRGCSSSAVTLKSGIQNMLMHYVPEVKNVVQVNNEHEEEGQAAFERMEKKLVDDDPLDKFLSN